MHPEDPLYPAYRREVLRASAMRDQLAADLREEFNKFSTSDLVGSLLIMSQANSPQELLLKLLNGTHPAIQGLASMSVMMAFADAIHSSVTNLDDHE